MIRATTPNITLIVGKSDLNLEQANNVYVAFRQGDTIIELTGNELEISGNQVSCYLTQQKSLQLQEGMPAKLQVNWTYEDDSGQIKRAATTVKMINVGEQLLTRVLS